MEAYQQCVRNLIAVLQSKPELKEALEISIKKAEFPEIKSLEDYYRFLNDLLIEIPTHRTMSPLTDRFHYLIAHSPGNLLKKDQDFRNWLKDFSRSHGAYLDTIESAAHLDTFIQAAEYHMEDYHCGASGWLTFNQFFTRHVKPGKRPVDGLCDDTIIVSPADSTCKGSWTIDDNSKVTAKGTSYSVMQLLDGSEYQEKFRNGIFTHSYLSTTDYHRFHMPVAGAIKELKLVPGDVIVDMIKKEDGSLDAPDEVGFQFRQTRGLIIIDSPVGLVAVLPIGMGHVSSVTFTAECGTTLVKGEEFGYFAYGGSDIVMLFQADKVKFTAAEGTHYRQGETVARAANRNQ